MISTGALNILLFDFEGSSFQFIWTEVYSLICTSRAQHKLLDIAQAMQNDEKWEN